MSSILFQGVVRALVFFGLNAVLNGPLWIGLLRRKLRALFDCWALLAVTALVLFAPRIGPLDTLQWNWQGMTLAFGVALLAIPALGLRFGESGFGRPIGSMWLVLIVASVPWAMNAWDLAAGARAPTDLETVAFQLTLPGLAEEALYRGVLWARIDKAFPPKWKVAGASVGISWPLTSLWFFTIHLVGVSGSADVSITTDLAALFSIALAGVSLGWIRARTNSIWPCVIVHNVTNSIMFVGSMLLGA